MESLARLARRATAFPVDTIKQLYPPALTTRSKRYEAYDAAFDQESLNKARKWYMTFEPSQLPKGNTSFARSSGPGGQHVNKTESKALTVYPVKELLNFLPEVLHPGLRSSKHYTSGNDSLSFQAQSHRSRTANTDENKQKLVDEIRRIYHERTPAETSKEKREKHQGIEQHFHESRIKEKKAQSAKKQSRKGPSD